MKANEINLHAQIDALQNLNKEDQIDDARQEFLSDPEKQEKVDKIQDKLKNDFQENDVIRPELRVQFLADLFEYLDKTEFAKLKSNFYSDISGFLARLTFLETMEDPTVRGLMDNRRAEQDAVHEDEKTNDYEANLEKSEIREAINAVESEFGIDIQGAINEVTLQGINVLQKTLSRIRSMPEYRDILEVVPYLELAGKEKSTQGEKDGHGAAAAAYGRDFHLRCDLDHNACFSFEVIMHELTHIKDYIYRLRYPKTTEKNQTTEASHLLLSVR